MKNFLTILILFFSFSINSQITQGEFKLELLNLEANDEFPGDANSVDQMKGRMNDEIKKAKLYFNKNYASTLEVDEYGDEIKRTVFRVKDSVNFLFMISEGLKFYQIDTLNLSSTQSPNFALQSSKKLSRKKFGFNLIENKYLLDGQEVTLVYTADVVQPTIPAGSIFPIPENLFMVEFTINQMGLKMTVGISEFSEAISNEDVFSTSIEGYESRKEFLSSLEDVFSSNENEEKKGEGVNLDIIEKLVLDKLIDSDAYNLDDYRNENASVDKFEILEHLARYSRKIIDSSVDSLNNLLQGYDLYNQETGQLFKKLHSQNDEMSNGEKWDLLEACVFKEHLNQKENRIIIAQNIKDNPADFGLKETDFQKFVDGKLNLGALLFQSKILSELPEKTIHNMEELNVATINFFKIALAEDLPKLSFSENDSTIIINDGNRKYFVDKNSMREYDYDNEDYETEHYKDTFQISGHSYNNLKDKLKQIAADNKLGYSYAIINLSETINGQIEYYRSISEKFPELKFFKPESGLLKFKKSDYFEAEPIGVSFLQKDNPHLYQMKLYRLFSGDIDAGIDYITTAKKNEFLDYIKKHKDGLELTEVQVKYIAESLPNRLYSSPFELISLTPNLVLSFTENFGENPGITENRTSFEQVFSEWNRFLKGDFDAKNLFYNSEKRTISLKYKKEEYTLPAENKKLMPEIAKILRKRKNAERDIYVQAGIWPSMTKIYYYLTLTEKKELQELFDMRFKPLK